ncbi:hypothetical protein [Legionella cardiaca]|uniref:FlgJ-like protein n=1 Tax=Legionella cardiaca TaxID=1071983 RepID=A0ABY8ART8_9GAMM|nr:hypothetical protein [Legionella cardiaca]WED42481.1 hypothetical protein PXX05_11220 [Legionella cardiaca]
MEKSWAQVTPHPKFLELLFTFRTKLFTIFGDVLGLHGITHIAITRINNQGELLTFSSTPALEFNLFKNNLWQFDRTYDPAWFQNRTQSEWSKLYNPERYDELYYIKQIKHQYLLGYSLSTQLNNNFFIYSLASNQNCTNTRTIYENHFDDFYKIGDYCSHQLTSLFHMSEN